MSNDNFTPVLSEQQEQERYNYLVADDISTNINAPLFGTITKDNISKGAAAIAKLSKEHGVISPLELHVKLKAIKAMCDEALALIEEDAKTLAKNGQGAVVDADTGEVIEPAILDMGKDTITVKFQ